MAYEGRCALNISRPVLWRRLSELGLKRSPIETSVKSSPQGGELWLVADSGNYYTATKRELQGSGIVNCECNVEMFLAIAALRDDTDFAQWFISAEDEDFGEWFLCYEHKATVKCRKATLHEIMMRYNKD